jgi:cytochrome c-type biogenesis protein CcmH/NrfF
MPTNFSKKQSSNLYDSQPLPSMNDLTKDWKQQIKDMYKCGSFDEEIIVWLDDQLGNFMLDN